jgi:hypothetical protein
MKFRITQTGEVDHLEDIEFDTLDKALDYCFVKYDKLWNEKPDYPSRRIVVTKNPVKLGWIDESKDVYGYIRCNWDYEIEIYNDYRE